MTQREGSIPLPVIQPRPGLRVRRPGRWRTATLVAVHVAVVAHVVHWRLYGTTLSPVEPSEAMEVAKHGVVNAGAVFFAAAILATAVFGRFFCGWGCHLVALQDLCRWLLLKLGLRPRPLRSRLLLLVPLAAFVYMFLWPAVYRLWVGLPSPDLRVALTTSDLWATFPGWAWGAVTFVVCGFAAVWVLGAKGFCTYACPYGAAFALVDRVAPLRIRVSDACRGCAQCTAVCSSNVRVHEEVATFGAVVDPGCMKCLDCVAACPNQALSVGFGRPAVLTRPRAAAAARRPPLSWPEELLLAVVFTLSFVILRGLYGVLPFLLSLGAAACVAAVALAALRALGRREAWLGPLRLVAEGRLRPAGKATLALAALLAAALAHSAAVHLWTARGHAAFAATGALRAAALDLDRPLAPATGGDAALVERARAELGRAERWGLLVDPTLAPALAWLDLLAGDREAHARHLAQALATSPAEVDLNLLAGRSWAERGDTAAALAAYDRVLAVAPGTVAAMLAKGALLGRAGRLSEAAAVFAAGVVVVPDHPELHFNLGVARAMLGDADGAVAAFAAAVRLAPDHLRARENLAGVLLGAGRGAEAVPHLAVAVRLSPADPVTRLMAAQAAAAAGDRDAARAHLAVARSLDPSLPDVDELEAALVPGEGSDSNQE